MISALCYIETKGPMEGFVSGIYQFQISLSAMTVPATIEPTPKTRMCSWELLASR